MIIPTTAKITNTATITIRVVLDIRFSLCRVWRLAFGYYNPSFAPEQSPIENGISDVQAKPLLRHGGIAEHQYQSRDLPVDTKIESRDGFLWITATGHVSLIEAAGILNYVCDEAVEHQLTRVLVDCSTLEGELSIADRYEFGCKMADSATESHLARIAFVGHPPLINGFAALVAYNRGTVAATFDDLDKAISWLRVHSRVDATTTQ
jgi:hypothetical protein